MTETELVTESNPLPAQEKSHVFEEHLTYSLTVSYDRIDHDALSLYFYWSWFNAHAFRSPRLLPHQKLAGNDVTLT